MNNDLISREALKKAFEKVYPLATNEMGVIANKQIYELIDNAPTVNIEDCEGCPYCPNSNSGIPIGVE